MAVLLAFAFISGIITILSPCILPVLPIVLSGSVGGGRARPFGIVSAFVVSFTLFTLALSGIVQAIGIPPDALRLVSVVLLVIFGIVMLVPALRDRFELLTSRMVGGGRRTATGGVAPGAPASRAPGFWSGVPVGFSLGLVWTPCVGPIMASVISLALTQRVDGGSVFITLAYSIGTSIPMLAVMFGGRTLLNRVPALSRNMANIQKGFGVVMIVVGLAIAFGWDQRVQTALLRAFPSYGSGLTAIEQTSAVQSALNSRARAASGDSSVPASANGEFQGANGRMPATGMLADYGTAPPLIAKGPWYNTAGIAGLPQTQSGAPLTMKELKGKVVLVDFWTYSCVNCVRTIPYLQAWYKAYKDKGLVIIGVHTPEFEFEKVPRNVQTAIKKLGVTWPVVQDNNYAQWNAYHNQFWPATYFIGPNGHVRYFHFGEGDYKSDEKVIQALLRERGANLSGIVSRPDLKNYSQTPETYLGYARGDALASPTQISPDTPTDYRAAPVPKKGEWNISGRWTVAAQYIAPDDPTGTLTLRFQAKNVFLVVQPEGSSGTIEVRVDGRVPADTPDDKNGVVRPTESRLYQLVGLKTPGEHVLQLKVSKGLRLFAFTFG